MGNNYSEFLITGGGIAGLTLAYLLAKKGHEVRVIEKSDYPQHKVCGEYLSKEVPPFFDAEGLLPNLDPFPVMTSFELSDTKGNLADLPLDLGGIGISRYLLDNHLQQKAVEAGAVIHVRENVHEIQFHEDRFNVVSSKGQYQARWVIGAHGKRSMIDRKLDREFMQERSPYMGVKYHVKNDSIDPSVVALYNFEGGYCGVNAVENGVINICYLAHREVMNGFTDLSSMEEAVLHDNPVLKKVLTTSEPLWPAPKVINEISFATKTPTENHVIMLGDAAGMITPLWGNGMAIAFHSSRLLADVFAANPGSRQEAEHAYQQEWARHFAARLQTGRYVQKLFGRGKWSRFAVGLGNHLPTIARWIMTQTHGEPFS